MRSIPAPLFQELCSQTCRIATAWLVTRTDGEVYGFTTSDFAFTYNGVSYTPTNGFNPSAVVSKSDFSVDNMEVQVLDSPIITQSDLLGGKWSNAAVQVFWICPDNPEWGIVPLRGGIIGETVVKEGQWTAQLRSLLQQMQQPLGVHFTVQCNAQLGDARCGVKLDAPTWQPNTAYQEGLLSDAKIGAIVKPTVDNDFWYVAQYTTETYQMLETDVDLTGGLIDGGSSGGTNTLSGTDSVEQNSGYIGLTAGVTGSSNIRSPSQPGQGLSANDDLGPNDQTQVAVGPAPDDLSQFTYQGDPVDIFGIKI